MTLDSPKLYAWYKDQLIGEFERDSFTYYSPDSQIISLSFLPGEDTSQARPGVIKNWLFNLLPEEPTVKEKLAALAGTGNSLYSLLAVVGKDLSGAIVLTSEPELPSASDAISSTWRPSGEFEGYLLHKLETSSVPPAVQLGRRMSLAGVQTKFGLCIRNGYFTTSTFENPSTHIFKIPSKKYHNQVESEVATLRLAEACGIPAAQSFPVAVGDSLIYCTERFDRAALPDGKFQRLHMESVAQSAGISSSDRYSTGLSTVAGYLPDEILPDFMRQLIFNTHAGNCDAHWKNYSVFLYDNDIRLTPLYDSLPTVVWGFRKLATPVSGKEDPMMVSLDDWAWFADHSGIPFDVRPMVMEIVEGIRTHVASEFVDLPDEFTRSIMNCSSSINI